MSASLAIPLQLTVGDTWAFTLSIGEYPRPTWTATAYFRTDSEKFSAIAGGAGPDQVFSVPAVTTADYKAGKYRWQVRVSDGTTKITLDEGWISVLPDPAATGNSDPRGFARQTLDALESWLLGNAATAMLSNQIKDRSITRHSLTEIRQWRNELRAQIRAEESAEKKGRGRDIKVRFVRI